MSKNRKRSVFVIDDSEWHNIYLRCVLENKGYQVQTFNEGEHMLKCIEKQKPHLIISDINMPEMNGFELLEEIRKIPSADQVPVIYVSSEVSDWIMREIRKEEIIEFIKKPLDEEYILESVDRHLGDPGESLSEKVHAG
ncbi:MAG: response regulator [Balneolaceae bacterium]|nr:response regulator [Balneolaceae bacterium]